MPPQGMPVMPMGGLAQGYPQQSQPMMQQYGAPQMGQGHPPMGQQAQYNMAPQANPYYQQQMQYGLQQYYPAQQYLPQG